MPWKGKNLSPGSISRFFSRSKKCLTQPAAAERIEQIEPVVVDVNDEQSAGLENSPHVVEHAAAVLPSADHAQRAEEA